jgi:SecD/SecF fusion protein
MIVMFRIPGLVATLSLIIYTALVLFLVSVYDLTLTLPGIAGIVVGAYSSVCLTSAMWYVMGGKKRGVVEENNKKAASKKEVFEDGSQV